jgi:hypothetical protein
MLSENRLLVAITGAAAVVLGAMIGLALGSAWFVVFALVVHLAATAFVAILALRLSSEVDKPGPTTVARLQAAGVRDPEGALNDALKAQGGRAARQSEEMTPSAVETELVGPGSEGSLREEKRAA